MTHEKAVIQSLMIFSVHKLMEQVYEELASFQFRGLLTEGYQGGIVDTEKWRKAQDELGTKILDLIFEATERYVSEPIDSA